MKGIAYFTSLLLLLGGGLPVTAEVVFEENFETALSPEGKPGWQIHADAQQTLFRSGDGRLTMTALPGPLNSGHLAIPVPVIRKGALEFQLQVDARQSRNARGFALYIDLYHLGLWWHDYVGDWRRYLPEPESRRITGFRMEPVGHRSLAPVAKGKVHRYRVTFDADLGEVAYYVDNMEDPVMVDFDVPILGRAEFQGGWLRIGSLGNVNGPVDYEISDLKLIDRSKSDDSAQQMKPTLIFQGIGNNGGAWEQAVEGSRRYQALNPSVAQGPKNHFKLLQFPTSEVIFGAKTLVWGDLPLSSEVLPYPLQQRLASAVDQGLHLILHPGFFALNKGQLAGSPLAALLPVTGWEDRWAWERLGQSGRWEGALAGKLVSPATPLYHHRLTPADDAEVLLRWGELPAIVSRKVGKGRITLLLMNSAGPLQATDPWALQLLAHLHE